MLGILALVHAQVSWFSVNATSNFKFQHAITVVLYLSFQFYVRNFWLALNYRSALRSELAVCLQASAFSLASCLKAINPKPEPLNLNLKQLQLHNICFCKHSRQGQLARACCRRDAFVCELNVCRLCGLHIAVALSIQCLFQWEHGARVHFQLTGIELLAAWTYFIQQ